MNSARARWLCVLVVATVAVRWGAGTSPVLGATAPRRPDAAQPARAPGPDVRHAMQVDGRLRLDPSHDDPHDRDLFTRAQEVLCNSALDLWHVVLRLLVITLAVLVGLSLVVHGPRVVYAVYFWLVERKLGPPCDCFSGIEDVYKPQFERICRTIEQAEGQNSIAVVGGWGAGKTQFLLRLADRYNGKHATAGGVKEGLQRVVDRFLGPACDAADRPDGPGLKRSVHCVASQLPGVAKGHGRDADRPTDAVAVYYNVWRHQSEVTPEWAMLYVLYSHPRIIRELWRWRPFWTLLIIQMLKSIRLGVKGTDVDVTWRGVADTFLLHRCFDKIFRRLRNRGIRLVLLLDEIDRCDARTTLATMTLIARYLKACQHCVVTSFVMRQLSHKTVNGAPEQADVRDMLEAEKKPGATRLEPLAEMEFFDKFFDIRVYLPRLTRRWVRGIVERILSAFVGKPGDFIDDKLVEFLVTDPAARGNARMIHGTVYSALIALMALAERDEAPPRGTDENGSAQADALLRDWPDLDSDEQKRQLLLWTVVLLVFVRELGTRRDLAQVLLDTMGRET